MTESLNIFADRILQICAITAILAVCGFVAYYRGRVKERITDLVAVGLLGGGIPVGILFIFVPFKPDLTDKLRDFPVVSVVLGVVYLVFIISGIVEKFKK